MVAGLCKKIMLKIMITFRLGQLMRRNIVVAVCAGATFALLPGCNTTRIGSPNAAPDGLVAALPAGFFLPVGTFNKRTSDATPSKPGTRSSTLVSSSATLNSVDTQTNPRTPLVLLYASPATQAYFATGGLDAKINSQLWEIFLRKYKIPFQRIASVDQLEKSQPGVLLLPSNVALSDRERRAIVDFRTKGGGVLASWLTGVRNENGSWLGFDFMESVLDVKVAGNTQAELDDNFLMPYGDNPVTNSLPSGLRIWLDRPAEWHPLRLVGSHSAAQIMDWSRSVAAGKPGAAIVFDERKQASGRSSRSVVFGYPERLWLSSDPKALEAIAHNALMWLLRQPVAYTSAWPYPYNSAMVLAVDSPDVIADIDLDFAKSVEASGGRATYYVLTENAAKSADILKELKARGHEIAFLGDHFVGFKRQTAGAQAKRLDTMREEMKAAGIEVASNAGFHAPMESYDKVTEKLLTEQGFSHFISFMDATDSRLPFFAAPVDTNSQLKHSLVVLPRTQGGPEDSEDDEGPGNVLKTYLAELDLAEKMASLSVVRIPNQSMLGAPELKVFFEDMKTRQGHMWIATGSQTANWWRERERVKTDLDTLSTVPLLTVTIDKGEPLQQAVTVLVNLPEIGSALRLASKDYNPKTPKVIAVDPWRAAVVLKGLDAGTYRWQLYFDRAVVSNAK